MEYVIGFVIALFIALTGVGAGTITVPVLILFLGVPAPVAIGIGLTFSAIIKLILVPAQIFRGNIAWRTLGFMMLGGAPGVLIGSFFLKQLVTAGSQNLMNALLGAILVTTASWQILFSFRSMKVDEKRRDRSPWLAWLMFPVGAEVGFSSAGAGALGSAALLSFTPLLPAQVVGTDIAFGFLVSLIGSGAHWFSGSPDMHLLLQLVAGGVLGAIAGTMLSTSIPRRPLRIALWLWLLFLGGQFLFTSYHVWTSAHASKPDTPVHLANRRTSIPAANRTTN
jgi:uncharacterized membrane protein YfcA